jgi:ketosteroid isomerase-like protein
MSDANIQTIQAIYGAFGRGDVPAILERLADNAVFSFNSASPVLPWHQTFEGKRAIPGFFTALAENTTVRSFEPRAFAAGDRHVAVAVHFEHVLKNGRAVVEDQVHWWTFDAHGKIARLVHFTDTAALAAAARG